MDDTPGPLAFRAWRGDEDEDYPVEFGSLREAERWLMETPVPEYMPELIIEVNDGGWQHTFEARYYGLVDGRLTLDIIEWDPPGQSNSVRLARKARLLEPTPREGWSEEDLR